MTPAQLATLKAAILANPVLAAFPAGSDGAFELAAVLNAPASPAFPVWAQVSSDAVFDAITWGSYTPKDTPDGTLLFANRLGVIRIKQESLQTFLFRDKIDGRKPNIRGGLRDSVIGLPADTGGALLSAGGNNAATVMNALTRSATVAEKMLVTSSPTTGGVTAGLMGFEGQISYSDVETARAS